MEERSQRGFTLLEAVVSAGIAAMLALVLLAATRAGLQWNTLLAAREHDEAAVGSLADRLSAEADSAWAIFTPPSDLFARSNSDGHEIDFFARDRSNRPFFWAYLYDAQAQTVQRYLYPSPGTSPVPSGPAITGITDFFARTFPVTALQDPTTPLYSGLYGNAALHPALVHFGYGDAPWIAGGNQLTYVRIHSSESARELTLATQTAPSGYVVVVRYTPSPSPQPVATPVPPPIPCTLDANSYCSVKTNSQTQTASCSYYNPQGGIALTQHFTYTSSTAYDVYGSSGYLETAEISTTYDQIPYSDGNAGGCDVNTGWSPGEPQLQYNDPNLP